MNEMLDTIYSSQFSQFLESKFGTRFHVKENHSKQGNSFSPKTFPINKHRIQNSGHTYLENVVVLASEKPKSSLTVIATSVASYNG